MKLFWIAAIAACVVLAGCSNNDNAPPQATAAKRRVILFVWDGLRPDSINSADTPNLLSLRDVAGVNFTDNHSTFPTFTMMNAASFATGSFPGRPIPAPQTISCSRCSPRITRSSTTCRRTTWVRARRCSLSARCSRPRKPRD